MCKCGPPSYFRRGQGAVITSSQILMKEANPSAADLRLRHWQLRW